MRTNLLILGGSTEASALARALAGRGPIATLSYAGRVAHPQAQPIPCRVGGFGGVDGLVAYLREQAITGVVDATHPFAAQMSRNVVAACAECAVPLVALTRPPWDMVAGDRWIEVADIAGAVAELAGSPRRVFLATGRVNLEAFATQPQHHFVVRLVDPPEAPLPFPRCTAIVARGPFDAEGDRELMQEHGIDVVVAKNAGGSGAIAKLQAARALRLPVIMIERPRLPARMEFHSVAEVLSWIDRHEADLGV